MTLYQIENEYLELLAMMEDPDASPEAVQNAMDDIEAELENKLDSYIIVRKELEAEMAKWKAEKDRAAGHEESLKNNIRRINTAVMNAMQLAGKDKLPTEHFKLSIGKNGGLQPMTITGEVPAEFCRMEPDNEKIRAALDKGTLEFAVLEERGVHLNVR